MKNQKRKYVTDAGYEMMLPATDERVMTIDELEAKYSGKPAKTQICPHCGTVCYGDCQAD